MIGIVITMQMHFYIKLYIYICTGFLERDARFPKIKNILDQLSDDKEGKMSTFNI